MKQIDGSAMVCYRLTIATWKDKAMKFEYDAKEYTLECVAYISKWGLVYRDDESCITIYDDGSGIDTISLWEPENAVKKIYPGDKITITF